MKDIPALEHILSLVTQQDSQSRLKAADEILQYMKNPSNDVEFYGLDKLIDGVSSWVSCSNFKVSLAGIEVLGAIVDHIGTGFRPFSSAVIPVVVDRLGDSKQQVREDAQDLLLKFMDPVSTPQHVFEILVISFGHKNWRVREEIMHLLCKVLDMFGAPSLSLNKFVPHICKLLGDPNSQVRDTAINTLVQIYRHVGEKVRVDLSKKGIPSSRLSIIYAKFDDAAKAGSMVVVESNGASSKVNGDMETDSAKLSGPSRVSSAKKPFSASKKTSSKSSSSSSSGLAAGAVDEADFINSYSECPNIKVFSAKELSDEMTRIQTILSDDKNDWEQRVTALKKVRSLMFAGGMEYDNFYQLVKQQEGAFKLSVKDLRSAIVKEACVTLSYLSSQLGNQFEHTAEAVMSGLISLIINTAKVMATSGCTAIRIIVKNTHSHRLIPHFFNSMTSKSNIIRRQCAEYLSLILECWSTNYIKPHVSALEETIHKGLGDADPEARAQMRRAFWHFASHFKDKADSMMKQLDSTKQRMLESDRNLLSGGNSSSVTLPRPSSTSSSSSGKSLTLKPARTASGLKRQAKMSNSQNSLDELDSASSTRTINRFSCPVFTGHLTSPPATHQSQHFLSSNSSTGSLKLTTGRRTVGASSSMSKTSHEPRHGTTPKPMSPSRHTEPKPFAKSPSSHIPEPMSLAAYGRSLSNLDPRALSRAQTRSRKGSYQSHDISPTDVENRRRSRIPNRAVASQPGSRSTSPLRLGLTYPPRERSENFVRGYSPLKSKIPTPLSRNGSRSSSRASSRQSSRDPSPDSIGHRERRLSNESDKGKAYNGRRLIQAQAATKGTDSDEAGEVTEDAVWDAWAKSGSRRRTFSFNSQCSDDDDHSDGSSAHSERSFTHERERSRSAHRKQMSEDVTEIVRLCTSTVWSDRRDGILALQSHLRSPRTLGHSELLKIKDCLARFFFDSHNKVYSMFLDALCEFIVTYKADLQDWLFVLLSRLLTKLGTDLLSSLQSKIVRVLDVIRDSFPYDVQFSVLTRFITDQTQTPNIKVKIAILQYLQGLINLMDSSDFTNSTDTRLAVSRIITWNAEPKSADVRKESACVIVLLFELNTPEFSMMLSVLPKSFQDGATKLLHNHLKTSNQGSDHRTSTNRSSPVKSPTSNINDDYGTSYGNPRMRLGYRTLSQQKVLSNSENGHFNAESPQSPDDHRVISSPVTSPRTPYKNHFDEPLSPVSTGSLTSPRSHGPDSGFPEDAPSVSSGYHSDEVNSQQSEPGATAQATQSYNPSHYQDQIPKFARENGFNDDDDKDELDRSLEGMEKSEHSDRGKIGHQDSVSQLISILSDMSGDMSEEKKDALLTLVKLVRSDVPELWGEKFPSLLSGLLITLKDSEAGVRSLVLRTLKDMIRVQPYCFFDYNIKLIRSVLEANKDIEKEVVRAAEDTATCIAKSITPEDCINILSPVILNEVYPINLAAIKMLNKVVEDIEKNILVDSLPTMAPGLVKCYDHQESSVRKASVFCLVALHTIVGEDVLRPHLSELSGTKMKLLNLYIKRHQAAGGNGAHMT